MPFNYMGNKFKLLPQLDVLMDYTKDVFCDLFGGGSVSYNLGVKYGGILFNDFLMGDFHYSVKNDPFTISTHTKEICSYIKDKDTYNTIRAEYNKSPTPALLWALILTCNSNMMRFNKQGKFNQTYGNRSWNSSTDLKWESLLKRYKELPPIRFFKKPVEQLKKIFSYNSMIYLDPPYYNTEAGYNTFWDIEKENILLDYCLNSSSSIAVSGVLFSSKENSPLLVGLQQAGWCVHNLNISYEHVRKNKDGNYQEVLLTNY